MTPPVNVTAVVVTFNRRDYLERCLTALRSQTQALARIVVIDNASTDGTDGFLAGQAEVDTITMPENVGGAGGFARGALEALEPSVGFIWLMDDDCEPDAACCERLC